MKKVHRVIFSGDEILNLLGQEAMRRLDLTETVEITGYPKINRTFWSIDLDSIEIVIKE